MSATPRPWDCDGTEHDNAMGEWDARRGIYEIGGSDDAKLWVALCQDKDDAKMIVHRVNCHEKLVGALKQAEDRLCEGCCVDNDCAICRQGDVSSAIREALKAAEKPLDSEG